MSGFDERASLLEHLMELRKRVIRTVIIILVGFAICYNFSEQIFDLLRAPIQPFLPTHGLSYIGVMEKFMAHLKVSFLAGAILSCPFWLWQLWKFIAPGLYQHEKSYALGFLGSAVVCFLTGAAFCYYLVLPLAFKFLLGYGGAVDTPIITIDSYLEFLIRIILAFGLAFEMPVVLVFLGAMGVIDHKVLTENRRYAIVTISIFSAVITPPDAISMMTLLIPLLFLYEISIVLVKIFEKKRARTAAATATK